ncbi:unnamed protein product [Allacma fusca]|uniref:Uncharacterized protein n=1 Tax=Allacma fusca TaxID=39272 RepID=A0A8J2L603_9HEXA|nr:unnamed protein product [Allacma fusca]
MSSSTLTSLLSQVGENQLTESYFTFYSIITNGAPINLLDVLIGNANLHPVQSGSGRWNHGLSPRRTQHPLYQSRLRSSHLNSKQQAKML